MFYSVYDYRTQTYRYFQVPNGRAGTHAPKPPRATLSSEVGVTPEQAGWRLPVGAKLVGSGPTPKGRIASMGDASSSSLVSFVSDNLAMLAVGGVLVWHFWGKR